MGIWYEVFVELGVTIRLDGWAHGVAIKSGELSLREATKLKQLGIYKIDSDYKEGNLTFTFQDHVEMGHIPDFFKMVTELMAATEMGMLPAVFPQKWGVKLVGVKLNKGLVPGKVSSHFDAEYLNGFLTPPSVKGGKTIQIEVDSMKESVSVLAFGNLYEQKDRINFYSALSYVIAMIETQIRLDKLVKDGYEACKRDWEQKEKERQIKGGRAKITGRSHERF